jgi:hypothetical protein
VALISKIRFQRSTTLSSAAQSFSNPQISWKPTPDVPPQSSAIRVPSCLPPLQCPPGPSTSQSPKFCPQSGSRDSTCCQTETCICGRRTLVLHIIGWGDFRPCFLAMLWPCPGHRCRCRPRSSRSQSPLCLLSSPLVGLSWIVVSRVNLASSHGKHAQ